MVDLNWKVGNIVSNARGPKFATTLCNGECRKKSSEQWPAHYNPPMGPQVSIPTLPVFLSTFALLGTSGSSWGSWADLLKIRLK